MSERAKKTVEGFQAWLAKRDEKLTNAQAAAAEHLLRGEVALFNSGRASGKTFLLTRLDEYLNS